MIIYSYNKIGFSLKRIQMNIRDLKYLIAIADHNSFGKAARACFVSQPALSMQIKKLENTLGVQLIERNNKRLFITDVGALIIQQARDILSGIEALQEIANQSKDPFCSELHIGIIPTLAPYLLPLIIPNLTKLFPKLTLYLVEDTTPNLLNKVNEAKLDAAFLALPTENNFVAMPLFDEDFMLAVPLNHPYAKKNVVALKDLNNKTLLLLEDGHCLRDQALAVCHIAHASESENFRATSLETLRHMVAAGVGMTLMPKLSCRKNDNVSYIPFQTPAPKRTIGLVWRASTSKKVLLEHIVEQIKSIVQGVAG
jgi:LysR family hydrogen peroxide-inducible transcriptional activator